MTPGLETAGLVIGRRGWSLAVVDLSIPRGARLAVLGPNGGGKTTLLKTLGGLVEPVVGAVAIDGQWITGLPPVARARLSAYAPPPGEVAAPFRSLDMVLLPLALRRRLTPADRGIGLSALAEMGVEPLAARPFERLSSGQRQLILAARVLVQDTPLCLFDEPTATLDPVNRDRVEGAIDRLAARGRTVVFTSHDRSQLRRADQWLAVAGGRAWLLSPEAFDDEVALASIYGGAAPR
jgi:iron complex transport system ATP-binding protein